MTTLLLLLLCGFHPALDDAKTPPPFLNQLLEAHNKERAAKDLPPLTLDPRLTKAAEVHVLDMAGHSKMSHEGSDMSQPAERIARQKYRYVLVGENVAQGQEDVKEVMKAWMESPGHRDNILGDFTQMGASVYKDQSGSPFWCVDFGRDIPKLVPAEAAKDLIDRVNKAREAEKKPALATSAKLARAAQATAVGFAKENSLEAKGVETGELVAKEGYRYETLSQSMANGAPTPEAFLKSILMQEDQKKQYLDDFSEIGVGYFQAEDETPYWCVLFAKPRKSAR
jgi:uncharacterized protein YkwD